MWSGQWGITDHFMSLALLQLTEVDQSQEFNSRKPQGKHEKYNPEPAFSVSKGIAAKPDELNSTPRTPMIEAEQ